MNGNHERRFCESCGAELPAGVRFCVQCGEPLGGGSPGADSDKAISQESISSRSPAVAPAPVSLPLKMAGLSALAGAAIVLLAGGGWWWWTHQNAPVQPAAPATSEISPVPPQPLPPAAPETPKSQDPDIAAGEDLADMVLWLQAQPWVIALKQSMPKGVTVSAHAEPFDADGWSDVQFRENHGTESGLDPDVSPSVGIFRISRKDRTVQWLEPVSGDYVSLSEFLKAREARPPSEPPVVPGGLQGLGCDFETKPQSVPGHEDAVIVADPKNSDNHVARITGPEEMGFTLPVAVPDGTQQLAVSFRLLHPEATKLIIFEDGRTPEGIRLRVRLLTDKGNSAIRDMVVRPTGQWRKLEYVFYDLPRNVVQVSVEAIWMEGPIYVDDVQFSQP